MGRPRIFTDEQRREKRRIKSAKWRAANLQRAREIGRESMKRAAAQKALAEGREPGKVGRPRLYTEEEKRAKRKTKAERWNETNREIYLEKAKLRERAKRAGTFVSRALPRLTEDEAKLTQRVMSANRRARVKGNGGRHTVADILALNARQEGTCPFCSKPLLDGQETHVDHWVPIILGGSNGPENLRLLHATCNLLKGGRHPSEFGLPP